MRTGTASDTIYGSIGKWNGHYVFVREFLWSEEGPCPGHELDPMTYFGEESPYALWCPHCCGVAKRPVAAA
jgi:hypothetical protein